MPQNWLRSLKPFFTLYGLSFALCSPNLTATSSCRCICGIGMVHMCVYGVWFLVTWAYLIITSVEPDSEVFLYMVGIIGSCGGQLIPLNRAVWEDLRVLEGEIKCMEMLTRLMFLYLKHFYGTFIPKSGSPRCWLLTHFRHWNISNIF